MNLQSAIGVACTIAALGLPLFTRLLPAHAGETTVGLCETPSHLVRIYQSNQQLKLRAYDRDRKIVWLDTRAGSRTKPDVVEYANFRSELLVVVQFLRNDATRCSVTVGNKTQPGRVVGY